MCKPGCRPQAVQCLLPHSLKKIYVEPFVLKIHKNILYFLDQVQTVLVSHKLESSSQMQPVLFSHTHCSWAGAAGEAVVWPQGCTLTSWEPRAVAFDSRSSCLSTCRAPTVLALAPAL